MGRKKTTLARGAKVWAKLLTTGPRPNGRVLHRETLELLQKKLGEDWILVEQENGEVSLCGTVEVGKVREAGSLLIRSKGVSLGPSELRVFESFGGTSGPITCEWCGREWNEDADPENGGGEDLSILYFNGSQIVGECCGKLFDNLFAELGRTFFEHYLKRLARGEGEDFEIRGLFEAVRKIRDRGREVVAKASEALGEEA